MKKILLMICMVSMPVFAGPIYTENAPSVTVNIDGAEWEITYVRGTWNELIGQLEQSPWWNNPALADSLLLAIGKAPSLDLNSLYFLDFPALIARSLGEYTLIILVRLWPTPGNFQVHDIAPLNSQAMKIGTSISYR